ncbi:MAG: uroporphyrinogen-III C-methyltransferase [Candidatus Thiodiazotropha sp. (ex Epidulcina cf. delphinae)]|nr:uroporphyrinogen-III C-methyltransferase [Candidatus Thiodiazotropha sp. (ex Epidulcina cf. delphinae)]
MSEKEHQSGQNQSDKEADFEDAIEGEVERLNEPKGRNRSPRLAIGLAFAALLAVAVGLLFGYRYWADMKQTLTALNDALQRANQEQISFGQRLQQSQQALEQQQQAMVSQQEAFADLADQLMKEKEASRQQGTQLYRSLSEIQTRLGGREGEWRVAEAEYLMRVANHRLTLMGDHATALEALKAADERLNASGDPGWAEVRETLAGEITRLTALPEIDTAGVSAELTALADQAERLPLRDEGVVQIPAQREAADTAALAERQGFDLAQLLDDLWQGFKSMMVIRHHDRPVSAMLPPEQRYFLMQNLRLKLETAKAALMGRNQPLYRENLQAAAEWVEGYFEVADPGVSGFRDQLQGLADRQIAPALPDISASLRDLQARRQAMSREDAR